MLAGFGEGWKVGDSGEVVGANDRPGRAVARRSAGGVAFGDASLARGHLLLDRSHARRLATLSAGDEIQQTIGPDPQATIRGIEQQLGPQTITVTGVPPTSHFARVLVAADYRMKRLAMNFDPPPIAGLPSYLQMCVRRSRQALGHAAVVAGDQLRSAADRRRRAGLGTARPGVKAMTEEDFLHANGERVH